MPAPRRWWTSAGSRQLHPAAYGIIWRLTPVHGIPPGNVICFFSVKILLPAAYFKEKFTARSKKSKKEEKKRPERKNLFDFFDLVVTIYSFVCANFSLRRFSVILKPWLHFPRCI
jgi:hypothetical protein